MSPPCYCSPAFSSGKMNTVLLVNYGHPTQESRRSAKTVTTFRELRSELTNGNVLEPREVQA